MNTDPSRDMNPNRRAAIRAMAERCDMPEHADAQACEEAWRAQERAASYVEGRGMAVLATVPMPPVPGTVPHAYVAAEWSDIETVTWRVACPHNGEAFAEAGSYFRGPDRFRDAAANAVRRAANGGAAVCDGCAHTFGPNDARHEVRVPGHDDNGRVFCDGCADAWERANDPEGVEADERAWREWCRENMPEHADAQACEEAWQAQTAAMAKAGR